MSGLLVIISSPSGGGKDSVINALLKIFPGSARLVTTTSRPLRPGNQEGVDYYFISREEFEEKIKSGEFLEHNFYAGNYYGTQKKHLEQLTREHPLVLTQIEVNGKHNLDIAGIKNLSIFLLPESLETLKKRIEKRGGLTEEIIEKRLAIAKKEINASEDYDYRLVNREGHLEDTIQEVAGLIASQLMAGVDKSA